MMTKTARTLIAAAAAATAGLGGPSFTSTWKAPDARPGTFQGKTVVAVFMSADDGLRQGIEGRLAYELTQRGAKGIAAWSLIPSSEIRDEAKAKARITQSGAAGVVALRLAERGQEASSTGPMYWAAPTYGNMWGGYWGYGWGGLYDPGHVRVDNVLYVEALVYSLEQNKLVWAGLSKTTNPKSANDLVKELVGKVASEVKKAGLVQKGG
jgi:hypothetical protein